MFGLDVAIPRGKRVTFPGIESLADVEMILESDLTIKFNNTYENLLDLKFTGGLKAVKDASVETFNKIFKTNLEVPDTLKQFGFQQWSGTSPIFINFTGGLYLRNDAYEEVIKPLKTLLKLVSPKLTGSLGGLSAPGATAYDVFTGAKAGMPLQVGPCYFSNCNIHDVEPTISQEVDTRGYPIWAKVTISAATLYTTNDTMFNNMFGFPFDINIDVKEAIYQGDVKRLKTGESTQNRGTPRI